jgi:N6-adenosine-specific RNA methylase IME4
MMLRLRAPPELPVSVLASSAVAALFLWCTWPTMPIWHAVIEAWGFWYSGLAFRLGEAQPERRGPALGQRLRHPIQS